MTVCGASTIVKDQGVNKLAVPLLCRSWYCDHCAPIRQNELKRLVEAGEPNTFITLSVRGRDDGEQARRAAALRDAWRLVVRRARREARRDEARTPHRRTRARHWQAGPDDDGRWPRQVRLEGATLPHLTIFEQTKRGEPHVHIAARSRWIDQRWLSREMGDLIGAPVVGIERVHDPATLGRYVAKYITKEPRAWPGCKRYWRSQDYAPGPPLTDELIDEIDDAVELFNDPVNIVVAAAHARGWRVEWIGEGARLWRP